MLVHNGLHITFAQACGFVHNRTVKGKGFTSLSHPDYFQLPLLPKCGYSLQGTSVELLNSVLAQVIFSVAPQPLLEEFHSSFLSGDLPALASHPSANFALQAFLAAANRSPLVKKLLAELKGSFKELLQRRRSGVVAAMLAACARTGAGQADASKALAAALTSLHDEGKVSVYQSCFPCAVIRTHYVYRLSWHLSHTTWEPDALQPQSHQTEQQGGVQSVNAKCECKVLLHSVLCWSCMCLASCDHMLISVVCSQVICTCTVACSIACLHCSSLKAVSNCCAHAWHPLWAFLHTINSSAAMAACCDCLSATKHQQS